MSTSTYKHILQFSNNYTVTFEKGGGKVHCTIKEGDQQRATTSGELKDYKRMVEMVVGDIPYDEDPVPSKPGTGANPAPAQARPLTGTMKGEFKEDTKPQTAPSKK